MSRKRRQGRATAPRSSAAAASSPPPAWLAAAPRAAGPLWLVATAATIWSLAFRSLLNSDLWFHLAAGREIWQRRAIPRTDSWSFTAAGRPWHNHEWLADVVFHGWERLFGLDALVYWQWLVEGGAYLLLWVLLRRLSGSPAVAALLAVLAFAVGVPFYDIRPNLWSVLFFVVLLALTLGRERPSLLPLAPLFVVWANLHGGVMLGILALPVLLAGHASAAEGRSEARARLRAGALCWLGAVAAACLNPWGWRVFSYVFGLATAAQSPSRTRLYEWLPPWVPGGVASPLFPLAVLLAAASALPLLRRVLRPPRDGAAVASLGLALLTLAMALSSRRFIPFFAIAQSLLTAQALAPRLAAWSRRTRDARRRAATGLALALAMLVLAVVRLAPYPLDARAFDPLNRVARMPVESLTFLEINGLGGNLFVPYLWGGYVEYRAAGRLRVHLDPRSETVFSAETQRQHFRVLEGRPGWQDALARSGADLVLWSMDGAEERARGQQLAASGQWRPLYRDGVSLLLVRSDVALPAPLREPPDSALRSWASGRQRMAAGRYAEAVPHLERALAQDPRLWPACQSLAVAQAMTAGRPTVEATVERCQEIFPFPYFTADSLLGGTA
jgi:hypothetical protein